MEHDLAEAWRAVFDLAVAPELSDAALECLKDALCADSEQLVQQMTVDPPCGTMTVGETAGDTEAAPCEAADAVAYALWRDEKLLTVGEVAAAFEAFCRRAAARLDASADAARLHLRLNDFFGFWDCRPRAEAVAGLLAAVRDALSRRDIYRFWLDVSGVTACVAPCVTSCVATQAAFDVRRLGGLLRDAARAATAGRAASLTSLTPTTR